MGTSATATYTLAGKDGGQVAMSARATSRRQRRGISSPIPSSNQTPPRPTSAYAPEAIVPAQGRIVLEVFDRPP